tara:strand:- start:1104 stop:1322 length:219 start_codon:yes stop_codon:yes gene_type:complete
MNTIEIGDYVRDERSNRVGIVIASGYERQHQYLERELYYNILCQESGKIIRSQAYDCTLLQEVNSEDSSGKR